MSESPHGMNKAHWMQLKLTLEKPVSWHDEGDHTEVRNWMVILAR
jgi:hypothetical protein